MERPNDIRTTGGICLTLKPARRIDGIPAVSVTLSDTLVALVLVGSTLRCELDGSTYLVDIDAETFQELARKFAECLPIATPKDRQHIINAASLVFQALKAEG